MATSIVPTLDMIEAFWAAQPEHILAFQGNPIACLVAKPAGDANHTHNVSVAPDDSGRGDSWHIAIRDEIHELPEEIRELASAFDDLKLEGRSLTGPECVAFIRQHRGEHAL